MNLKKEEKNIINWYTYLLGFRNWASMTTEGGKKGVLKLDIKQSIIEALFTEDKFRQLPPSSKTAVYFLLKCGQRE